MKRTAILLVFLLALALPALAADPATNAPAAARAEEPPLDRFFSGRLGIGPDGAFDFVRPAEPLGPFPWARVRFDHEGVPSGVEARAVFRAAEGADPAPLLASLAALQDELAGFGARFPAPFPGWDGARAESSGTFGEGVAVSLSLRAEAAGAGLRDHVAELSVRREDSAGGRDGTAAAVWADLVPRVDVPAEGGAAAWRVPPPPPGPGAVELLKEGVRRKDSSWPRTRGADGIGTLCLRSRNGATSTGYFTQYHRGELSGYTCTRAEADAALDRSDGAVFVRTAPLDEAVRVSDLARRLYGQRPRAPGEARIHRDGLADGDILPGDRLVWHTGEYRDLNEAVVCAEGEDGIPVEAFGGVRVKNAVFTEMPRPEDYDWSRVEAVYEEEEALRRRAGEIERSAGHLGDAPSDERTRVLAFLRELAALERPGLYRSPYNDSTMNFGESRAQLLARIARKEREARGFFQCELLRLRADLLRHVAWLSDVPGRRRPGEDGPDALPPGFAAEAAVTRYERAKAEDDPALRDLLADSFSFWTLVPRRLPAAEIPPDLPPDAAARLDALAAAARGARTDGGRRFSFDDPFDDNPPQAVSDFAVEAFWQAEVLLAGIDNDSDRAERLPAIARLLVGAMPAEELPQFARRLVASFPRSPDAWRFAARLVAELLAERPGAATGSVDWRTPVEPQNEDDLRDLSARRGVEPIRSLFRTKAFASFLDSRDALPLSDRSSLAGELFGLLGIPRRDARDSPAEPESHAESAETAEPATP